MQKLSYVLRDFSGIFVFNFNAGFKAGKSERLNVPLVIFFTSLFKNVGPNWPLHWYLQNINYLKSIEAF